MEPTNEASEARAEAIARLKQAHLAAEAGRKELEAAEQKIKAAQKVIDDCAEILRSTPSHPPAVLHPLPYAPIIPSEGPTRQSDLGR